MTIALIAFVLTAAAFLLALNFAAGEKNVEHQLPRLHGTSDPQFIRAMGSLLGPGIAGGNKVSELINGDQISPAMLEARRTITFETYIYWSGEIGKQFADALTERARAGVQVRKFHKPHWYNLARMNKRTHRQLLVVDGKAGTSGAMMFSSSPSSGSESMQLMYHMAITAAERNIDLSTAYFVPGELSSSIRT